MTNKCDALYECKEDNSLPEKAKFDKCDDTRECAEKVKGVKYGCECKKGYIQKGDICELGKV